MPGEQIKQTKMPAQFMRSDTASEAPFMLFLPVVSLNVKANIEAPITKVKLKQNFLGPGAKRLCLCSHQVMVTSLQVSMLSDVLLKYLSQQENNFYGDRT